MTVRLATDLQIRLFWCVGFGLSQGTSYRYVDELSGVLAARAPGQREALERAWPRGRRT